MLQLAVRSEGASEHHRALWDLQALSEHQVQLLGTSAQRHIDSLFFRDPACSRQADPALFHQGEESLVLQLAGHDGNSV